MSPTPTGPATRAEDQAAIEAIAREAGALLLRHRGRLRSVEKKGARDLVSEADRETEELVVTRLRERFPADAILAEEGSSGTALAPRTWILDPLDGTTNFVHGLPIFSVSIGLWVEGAPELACVHVPVLDECFSAAAGSGATLNGEPIRGAPDVPLSEAVVATGFAYRREHLPDSNFAHFEDIGYRCRGIRRMGSAAVDLCYAACGRLHAYWELALSPWDVAAGGLIAREAGLEVGTIRRSDEDWLFGREILVAPPGLRSEVRAILLDADPARLPGPRHEGG